MIASVATTAGLSAQRSAEGLSPRRGGGGTVICMKIPPPLHFVTLVPLIYLIFVHIFLPHANLAKSRETYIAIARMCHPDANTRQSRQLRAFSEAAFA